MRTSYSVLGARKMHVIRGRPESAERHGAGHVARCTRPCASWVTWAYAASGAPGPRAPRAARRESSARPTSSKGISTRSDRTSCGSPTFPHCVGGTPSYARTFSGWVYVASVTDVYSRRIIGWQNHLPASVHRPGPRRPGDGRLATKTSGGRPDGPGASLATAACSTGLLASGLPWPSARRSPRWGRRATPFGFALAEALKLLVQGRAHPLARDPGRTSTPLRVSDCLCEGCDLSLEEMRL